MTSPSSISIRQGDLRAIESIMPVMDAAFDPCFGEAWSSAQCAGMMALPGTALFIAEKNSQPCGFALVRHVFEEAELLLIATHPDHRRAGIGSMLCEEIFKWCRRNGTETVFLEMRDGNPAFALYSRLGFVPVGRRPEYYKGLTDTCYDALTLRYNLN